MKILVDADACAVKHIITRIAREFNTPVTMFSDTSHIINDGYSDVVIVDRQRDSADIALVNMITAGDVVVTQGYGLAAMALGKGANVINQDGLFYTDKNIDRLLFERHIAGKIRRSGGRTSGPRKRSKEDNARFQAAFDRLIQNS